MNISRKTIACCENESISSISSRSTTPVMNGYACCPIAQFVQNEMDMIQENYTKSQPCMWASLGTTAVGAIGIGVFVSRDQESDVNSLLTMISLFLFTLGFVHSLKLGICRKKNRLIHSDLLAIRSALETYHTTQSFDHLQHIEQSFREISEDHEMDHHHFLASNKRVLFSELINMYRTVQHHIQDQPSSHENDQRRMFIARKINHYSMINDSFESDTDSDSDISTVSTDGINMV